jgi:hypothetical protein
MNAKEPARDAPDKTTGGILPTNNGRLCDTPAAKAAAAAPSEANRRVLRDAHYDE